MVFLIIGSEIEQTNYECFKNKISYVKKLFPMIKFDNITEFFRSWNKDETSIYSGWYYPSNSFSKQELMNRGIIDIDRLTYSYIRDHTLDSLFGEDKIYVTEMFLINNKDGTYNLSPSFRTEKAIKNESGLKSSRPSDCRIIEGLIKILNNVCLYQMDDKYIPSPLLFKTYSAFSELSEECQHKMEQLYYEYYERRNYLLWKQHGEKHLKSICNDETLFFGTTERSYYENLKNLNICSDDEYNYTSLLEESETQTLRSWWECSDKRLWIEMGKSGDAPQFCSPNFAMEIMLNKMAKKPMFVIFNLQDYMAVKDSYILNRNPHLEAWEMEGEYKYKCHVSLDELLQDTEWLTTIKRMIRSSNRYLN
ncbi:4-alpha-glucanotransferase [Entamoeba marina]